MVGLISVMLMLAFVSGLNQSAAGFAQARALRTATALAQAKEALIAYAVTYKDTHDDPINSIYTVPGFLPCPDLGPASNVEGHAAPNCGNALVSVMGRLPWNTLGLDALKDGSEECLWYAVSGTYKNNPNSVSNVATTTNNMNWDTNGQFTVTDSSGNMLAGSSPDNQAVAVIFAPGAPISGQNRTPAAGTSACSGNYSPAAYLDSANGINNSAISGAANAVSPYIASTGSSSFNDQLVYITRADIWNAIKKRSDFYNNLRALTRRAAECTAMYGRNNAVPYPTDKRLPWAGNVAVTATPSRLYYFSMNRRYADINATLSGRLPYRVSVSKAATGNTLPSASDLGFAGVYLFDNSSYCSYQPEEKIWYDNWKDHLFYALANRYTPTFGQPTGTCTAATCLKISNTPNTQTYQYYAAFVIFAGEKLASQSRSTVANKGLISNYLEGRNAGNHPNAAGNANYEGASASSTFNDIVYAIGPNLTVSCYDGASGTMLAAPSAACP